MDFVYPFSDDNNKLNCLLDGIPYPLKICPYQIAINAPYLLERYQHDSVIYLTSESKDTFIDFLTLVHEKPIVFDVFKDEEHKKIMQMIKDYKAYGALYCFVKSLKIYLRQISLPVAYTYALMIKDWKETYPEGIQEYRDNAFLKLENFVTQIVFKNFKKFNESILKEQYTNIPVSIMMKYLSKPIVVDNENTFFLYGIIKWSLIYKPKSKELLEVLKSCDYIKLTHTYVLYVLPKLEEKFPDHDIKQYIKDRRIICLETYIGGIPWLEKTRPTEFNSMKKRQYKKLELVIYILFPPSEKRIEDNKEIGYSEQTVIHSGFTWSYFAKFDYEDKIIYGNLEWKNDIWEPHFEFYPYNYIDLEILSNLEGIPQKKRIERGDAKKHYIRFNGDSQTLKININLIEEFKT